MIAVRGSIQRRLAWQLMAGAAVLALLLIVFVRGLAQQLAEETQDNILAASVTSILDTASFVDGALTLDLPYSSFSMLGNEYDDAVFYAIYADDVFQSGYADLPLASGAGLQFQTAPYRGTDIRIVTGARAIARGDRLITVTAAMGQSRTAQQIAAARVSRFAIVLGLGFFVAAALLAILASRAATRPLARLTSQLGRRGPEDLSPVTQPMPSEVQPLATALNGFMARLDTSLSRTEDFIAEAAHRVRSPLATVRMQAEVTLAAINKDRNREALRDMIRAVDESSRAAGQLLDHAMVSVRTDHLEPIQIDLGATVLDLVERQRATADLRDIEIVTDIEGAPTLMGDPVLVQNALTNVLDNAIKYTAAESTIRVTATTEGASAVARVYDEGPGLPAHAETLTERFARGPNVHGIVGSGLGLTIADEVTRAHNGTLTLANRTDKEGACVTLFFPSA